MPDPHENERFDDLKPVRETILDLDELHQELERQAWDEDRTDEV